MSLKMTLNLFSCLYLLNTGITGMCLQIQVMQSWRKTSKIYKVFKKGPFFSSFENSLLMLQAHLQNGICFICFIWVLFACLLFDSLFFEFFSNLNRNPLSDIQRTITLSHSVGFLSTQLIVSLAVLKLFSFMTSHLSILGQTESYFRHPFLHLHHLRRCLCFSSSGFSVSGFGLRSLIIWSQFLCKAIYMSLVSFFCIWTSTFLATACQSHFLLSSLGF